MIAITRIISASLSPNTESDDVVQAVKVLCTPWGWKRQQDVRTCEEWFEKTYKVDRAYSFNSGRSALFAILEAFHIGMGDEVLVQSFTCVAVPNSVLWCGAKPVYVDVDASLNLDVIDAEKKVTSNTKAIIVQHTFGIPADLVAIKAFADKHKLAIIEDCAHALGGSYRGKSLGLYGDASFFSFGRDKVISSVFGGMAIIKNRRTKQVSSLGQFYSTLSVPGNFWILQQILHPIIFAIILPLYTIGIGKLLLVLFQKLSFLSFPVYPSESLGIRPNIFPSLYPGVLARLLKLQLQKIARFNANRKNIAKMYLQSLKGVPGITFLDYREGSIFLRFPILVSDPDKIIQKAKRRGILLGNWYHNVIDPTGVDYSKINYSKGDCRKAEDIAMHIINLPTRITITQATHIIEFLKAQSSG